MPPTEPAEWKGIVAGFAAAPLFSGVSPRQLKQIAKFAKVRDIPPETYVVKQGEKGIGFYLVLEGRLQVRRGGRTIARLGPGEFFGELALFDDRSRSADVVTEAPTRVVVLSRWEFWGFANEHPSVLRTILGEMARRLQTAAPTPTQ